MVKPQTLKGFRDFLPKEARKRQYVLDTLKKVFESYGFEPLETPVLEYEEVLLGKYGDEGDKLMYRFTDNGDRKVAMRYDQTVPLARVVAQYQNDLPLPFKRYQIQNVWRAENTQKGRYREFLQVDVDTVGSSSPIADSEIIGLVIKSLEKLGFKTFKILANDRSVFEGLDKKAIVILDKLDKIGPDETKKQLIDAGFSENLLEEIKNKKPTQNYTEILEYLRIDNSKIIFESTLARGLDYYTGLIFEVQIEGYAGGSIGGGGRYDGLIGMFTNQQIPAVGFSFGFDRLIEVMENQDLFPKDLGGARILVTNTSNRSAQIANELRNRNIDVELYVDEKEVDKQLRYADKKGIPYILLFEGDNLVLKNMKTGKQKQFDNVEELIDELTTW
ncbi:MAG: histidine--tRNA ligase [Candidatus Levybacteria bacterium RIFOXYA1_FULL_41_10]|nr:MAG: Histidyl-tRNA synthetase [Candidatus Levybacteria bacterium GW2011_GWA2_41_15]OGH49951.1 MAG: histidine--tRNA ligase [Candidatus Levybacteria bacterium RIFCSPLOWO2_02_FULL_40_18]OGH52085.1 MAG: histidine--tRNA ligase [Candidatus Levybacteria bacterium RIFCSPLOWO2_12_FULL_41_12]OGH52804.1 MAG: histidine--tRNA ligase [Candidatus Levybacteria bacterium RIFOXYC1_FULL_40_10]OGH54447.1 MAG: histidine--tRNA ligase [Candidatus Levybacteria bacterium RIFOXYD1_FULL_40_21]OGH57174.1 MAG: histidin